MNLQSFTPSTFQEPDKIAGVPGRPMQAPSVRFRFADGSITFSKAAAQLLDLKGGELYSFHLRNEVTESPEWFIEKSADGFLVKVNTRLNSYAIKSRPLIRMVLQSFDRDIKIPMRMLISGQPTEIDNRKLYCLLQLPKT